MKISYVTAALILAAAACLGWRNHQQLVSTRTRNAELLTEAASLGITPDPEHPQEKALVTHRRGNRLKPTLVEYIAYIKEMRAKEKAAGGKDLDQETINRSVAFMDRLAALDANELQRLIADLRSTSELDEETRNGSLMLALITLSNNHPQIALALVTESEDSFTQPYLRKSFLTLALSHWAKSDPVAGVKWVKENGEKYPDQVDDKLKRCFISGAAMHDPKLAFQFIEDLKLKDAEDALSAVTGAAQTTAERTTVLNALREYTATLEDSKIQTKAIEQTLSAFAHAIARDGFQNAAQWLDTAKLSPTEMHSFSRGLSYDSIPLGETGQWVEWLGKNLPVDQASKRITSLVDEWTAKDYVAAGKWLTQEPEGPAKQAAVIGYVDAVASYEPETAAQWAMTLSSEDDRARALRRIYNNWRKIDPAAKAAAEAFADQHGIKR